RDSNSRYPCRYAGFRDRCLQPLGHLSKSKTVKLGAVRSWVNGVPAVSKEARQQVAALFRVNAGRHLRAMIEERMPQEVSNRPGHARLFVPRPKDDSTQSAEHHGARAHGARFERA